MKPMSLLPPLFVCLSVSLFVSLCEILPLFISVSASLLQSWGQTHAVHMPDSSLSQCSPHSLESIFLMDSDTAGPEAVHFKGL